MRGEAERCSEYCFLLSAPHFYNVLMGRKKQSRGGCLSWAGIVLLWDLPGVLSFTLSLTDIATGTRKCAFTGS